MDHGFPQTHFLAGLLIKKTSKKNNHLMRLQNNTPHK
jgi:hypothetical protein